MSEKIITLYIKRGKFKFSAGHFVILSATERETLHGHNFDLEIEIATKMQKPGISFDYRVFEKRFMPICNRLNMRCLLPGHSPFLTIEETAEHYRVIFNHQIMELLKQDVVVMPVANITLEELSQWFANEITADREFLSEHAIQSIIVTVFNSVEHGVSARVELLD